MPYRWSGHRLAVAITATLLSLPASAATVTCSAKSGTTRATLIELYTSEGCSSCPPADRWLSGFVGRDESLPPVVALAFHVDYWDYIGWRDRFASPAYTARQHARVRATRGRFAYTPQTVVDGSDSSLWRQARAAGTFAQPLATAAAGAELQLRASQRADGNIDVQLESVLLPAAGGTPAVAYLALYENGLSSQVSAGENTGRKLNHDFVVREWVGPIALQINGPTSSSHSFRRTGVAANNVGVAVVVESSDGARYLQALACKLQPGKQP